MNASGHLFIADKAFLAFDFAKTGLAVTMRKDQEVLSAQQASRLLMAVAAKRDRAAFAVLFGFYAPRLKAFLRRSGMTGSVAEDVAQETMLLVWKKASYFDPARAGASTWIFTIARNARIDRLRRDGRPAAIAEAFDPSDQPDEPVSGEQAMIVAQREERVRTALALLPPEQADILKKSFFGEETQSEIAEASGIALGTVKSRVRLALGRLRQILDDLK
ncbi:sigma-70 family RNA polymerase sigma factor [Mesorhizobium sp. CU2]|uniref:sigma-70 family RNA polymerase sigma factor n=1 Tax=unclassified Mesorhizobium TaxID=325217 RepID=UPI00112D7584|nr:MULTISPECIES: sigma-70 family RNA polymerase sigma factor [unclassified Mesorhizobium]TPN81858.1 sigma-70 family RNA polymerase sigma factor [Mesorhizobium sp. CU3]TPO11055.1 sigma-70 family RNA polymerase sigma factor [Mesorhizobium sp. CU2]